MVFVAHPAPGPAGYVLAWPPGLLRFELTAILAGETTTGMLHDQLQLLLAEAFAGTDPVTDLDRAAAGDPPGGPLAFARRMLGDLDTYPPRANPASDSPGRHDPPPPEPDQDPRLARLQHAWWAAIDHLDAGGYFDHVAGDRCENPDRGPSGHDDRMRALILEAIGIEIDWAPADPGTAPVPLPWGQFLSLVEVVGALAARPRRRWWHDERRHYDYADFHPSPGRAVYQWTIRALLAAHAPTIRITEQGHLITTPTPRAGASGPTEPATDTAPLPHQAPRPPCL